MTVIQFGGFVILSLMLVSCGTTATNQTGSTESVADTYIQLGLGYLQEGNKDQARFNLLKAIDAEPRSPDANNAIALLYQSEGELGLAEEHFKRALSSDRSFNQARYNYARMLLVDGRADDAEEQFSVLVEDVNYRLRAQAFLGLGMAREAQSNLDGAKEAYGRSYQRDPRVATALLELADIAVIEQDFIAAKEFLDQFESQTAATPRSLELGIDLAQRFNDADAEASYSMTLRNMFPGSREAREHILATQGEE